MLRPEQNEQHQHRTLWLLSVGTVLLLSAVLQAQSNVPSVRPFIRLEKPRYLLGESIRFWIGVEAHGTTAEISPDLRQQPCALRITKPDGTTDVQVTGWPMDGMVGRGWSGGSGFTAERAGVYKLVFDCAGEKTQPTSLTVEKNPISDKIRAEFHFDRSGDVQPQTPVPVILSVRNDSQYTIRFPKPGEIMQGIFVRVVRQQPASRSDLFYPWEKLSHSGVMFDTYSWDVAAKIPSIVLAPGEHFDQPLLLQDAYSFDQPGHYEVTFSTVLSVLVGESNGTFRDLCPIRVSTEKTASFVVAR